MTKSETQIPAPSYRGPLIVVIILGVLNVLALGALIGGAVMSLSRRGEVSGPYLETVAAPGGHIVSTQLEGNRILLRLLGSSGEELVVLDANSGRVLGRVAVTSDP